MTRRYYWCIRFTSGFFGVLQLFIESIVGEVDFRVPLSRQILEEQAAKAGLVSRITEPIRSVLAQANVSLDQLDVVELIGGGVRMPRVQVCTGLSYCPSPNPESDVLSFTIHRLSSRLSWSVARPIHRERRTVQLYMCLSLVSISMVTKPWLLELHLLRRTDHRHSGSDR